MSNHFKIIVPFYNVEKWIKVCIRSVQAQDYQNFQCILVDDISTDKSAEIARQEISGDDRFILVVNKEKAYALKNIYDAIKLSNANDEDIIVTLDGDDWLANRNVLSTLNKVYNEKDCWITYGSYAEYPGGSRGKFAKQIPAHVTNNCSYRQSEWCSSHLRTFKRHLWSKIKKQDLLDSEGNFYRMAWDLAFMFPMLEMAGKKSKYISDILYIYNLGNPLNDHKVDNGLQRRLERQIRAGDIYRKLNDFATPRLSLASALEFQKDSIKRWVADSGDTTHRINYNLNKDSAIIDLGGYKGEWAKQMFDKYQSNIVIYEPFNNYFIYLQKLFSRNDKIKVRKYGVGGRNYKAAITEAGLGTYTTENENGNIEIISIIEVLKDYSKIDLIKINVEGAEFEILDKLLRSEEIHKIKNLQIQFHPISGQSLEKYMAIYKNLCKTHKLTYHYPFIWENWSLK